MRIRIETNFNYYEDQPLLNTDVLEYPPNKSDEKINQFYGKKRKQKSDEIDSLFTSVLLVSSKNLENDDAYKDLIISSIRRKMEKEDDDLILKLYSKKVPSKSVADFFIQTGLYAGIIYIPSNKGAVEFHIKPRYGNVLLNRMLNVTNHIYMESGAFSAAKTKDNDDYFKYIIEYLFLHAYRQ